MKRKLRKAGGESALHDQAVKLRKMTDEQLCAKLIGLENQKVELERALEAKERQYVEIRQQNTALVEERRGLEKRIAALQTSPLTLFGKEAETKGITEEQTLRYRREVLRLCDRLGIPYPEWAERGDGGE